MLLETRKKKVEERVRENMEGKYRVLLVLVVVAFITEEALAAQHVVGGSQGWDESTDFSSWASGQKFKVGDQLVFKYSTGLHSLVELGSESAYKNCDIGTALDSKNSGKDVIKLNKAGTRYFACGTLGHCGQGMKLKITTVAGDATTSSPASSSTPTPTSTSTSTSTSSSSSSSRASIPAASVASVVTIMAALLANVFM